VREKQLRNWAKVAAPAGDAKCHDDRKTERDFKRNLCGKGAGKEEDGGGGKLDSRTSRTWVRKCKLEEKGEKKKRGGRPREVEGKSPFRRFDRRHPWVPQSW